MNENFTYSTKRNSSDNTADDKFQIYGRGERQEGPKPTKQLCPLCSGEGSNVYMLSYFDHLKCPRCDYIPPNLLTGYAESAYDGPLPNNMVLDFNLNIDDLAEKVSLNRGFKNDRQRLLSTY